MTRDGSVGRVDPRQGRQVAAAASSRVPSGSSMWAVAAPISIALYGMSPASPVPRKSLRNRRPASRGRTRSRIPSTCRSQVRAVHDRDDALGPVEPLEVLEEDRAPRPFARRVLLRHEHVVPAGTEPRRETHVPVPLRCREQRASQVDPHARSTSITVGLPADRPGVGQVSLPPSPSRAARRDRRPPRTDPPPTMGRQRRGAHDAIPVPDRLRHAGPQRLLGHGGSEPVGHIGRGDADRHARPDTHARPHAHPGPHARIDDVHAHGLQHRVRRAPDRLRDDRRSGDAYRSGCDRARGGHRQHGALAEEAGFPFASARHQLISKFPIIDPPGANGRYAYIELAPEPWSPSRTSTFPRIRTVPTTCATDGRQRRSSRLKRRRGCRRSRSGSTSCPRSSLPGSRHSSRATSMHRRISTGPRPPSAFDRMSYIRSIGRSPRPSRRPGSAIRTASCTRIRSRIPG